METIDALRTWLINHLEIGVDEEIEYWPPATPQDAIEPGAGAYHWSAIKGEYWSSSSLPGPCLSLRFHRHMFGINLNTNGSKVVIALPDSIATHTKIKTGSFDLCHPESLEKITTFIKSAVTKYYDKKYFDDPLLTWRDRNIIVDAFIERLPTVWADALQAIEGGEDPKDVIEEMEDGHILRILKKFNYDVNEFVNNFRAFAILDEETAISSNGNQR